jgi:hypothetical protein
MQNPFENGKAWESLKKNLRTQIIGTCLVSKPYVQRSEQDVFLADRAS